MTKEQDNDSTSAISRRTGLDRRWIPSAYRQPERRCGKDRRACRKRSFLELIELDGRESNLPVVSNCARVSPSDEEKP